MSKALGLACLLAGAVVCPSTAAAEAALRWSYEYVLATSTTDGHLYPAVAGVIEDAALRDPAMCDLLAEVMASLSANKIRLEQTYPALLRVLANVPNAARYREVVTQSRKFITGPGADKFVARYLEKVRRSKDAQYVPGTIDLAAIRDGYARSALAAQPSQEQARALANMSPTVSMDDMFALAGKPAAVVTRDMHFVATMGVEIRQLFFYYRGIGCVTFDFKNDQGWHLQGLIADPMAFETSMPYRGKAAELGLPDDSALAMIQLLSGSATSIKTSAQDSYKQGSPPLNYLDTAAELLLQNYATLDASAVDTYAWICNLLNDLGGPRYSRILATVAKGSNDDKLRKYASQVARHPAGIPETRYVPGSVSLDEQAKKFPTLYPQIAVNRGKY